MQLLQESDSNGYIGYVDFFQANIANETEVICLNESLTKSLASRYAKQGIRINAILPELVDTPFAHWLYGGKKAFECANSKHPRGIGKAPDEIASIIYFLASKDASYIIRHNLIADGGLSLK
ncbi:SDR family oxidoreductase [Bacillus sp. LL01]|uniref:SDR family oxidoreductase n=1 Tax=Bacillus sp. LL01 TaxID=1665556 RepID=UPI00069DDAFB|nr:SDR family oxidoreductase [Bacillus sp. LL01]